MPHMKVLSKDEWGGHPTRKDIEGEVLEKVELPAKYVIISATCSRPCTALEDCAILMKNYQEYFLYDDLPDVPFNFMVGPGNIALEGRGWHINSLDFKEEGVDEDRVWNSITEVKGFFHKFEDIKKLKKSLGFKKPKSKKQNMNKILAEIKKKKLLESLGEVDKDDMNKYFGKTITIGLITDVFFSGNPSSRALASAFGLIKYGMRNNYIAKNHLLQFNFDPLYMVKNIGSLSEAPEEGIDDPRTMFRTSLMEDFVDHFMFPSMKAESE